MPRAVPHDIVQGAMPLVVEEFLSWMLTERGRAANTLAAYRRDLERYCSWLQAQSLDLAAVAMGDLDRFVGERRQVASPATESGSRESAVAADPRRPPPWCPLQAR